MTHFRINFRKFVGLSSWLMVMLSSSAAFAQPKLGQPNDEGGLSSYIFSPRTVTVVLVLLLVAQLVYRSRSRRTTRPAISVPYNSPMLPVEIAEPDPASKRRYDKEELSKLLKASASTKNNGRSLEEAIRLSQAAQDDLLDTLDVHLEPNDGAATAVEPEVQDFEVHEQLLEEESPSVEAEAQSVEVESNEEVETSK